MSNLIARIWLRLRPHPRGRMMLPVVRSTQKASAYVWQCELPLRLLGSSNGINELGND